jgi:hypothetical protein
MSCKIIKAILDTVSTAISTAAIRTKPSDEPSSKPSSMPSLQPLLQPSSELPTMPISKPSGEPSSKPSSTPYIQPLSQPSSKPSIKPSSKPSDASSKQSSTKLLEGLASLGSSLDLSLGSLGMFGLSLESPGGGGSHKVMSGHWVGIITGAITRVARTPTIGSSVVARVAGRAGVAWIVAGMVRKGCWNNQGSYHKAGKDSNHKRAMKTTIGETRSR